MKKVLKMMLRVYSIFCMCLTTILLITGIVVWVNFGKITSLLIEKVINSYNTELNGIISDYFESSVPDKSIQFISVETIEGGGLRAAFSISNNAVNGIDIGSYQEKSNEEIIAELGITADAIPAEIIPLLSMVKENLVIDIKDKDGNTVLNRSITSKEIAELLKTRNSGTM